MVINAPICMRSVANYSFPWPDLILSSKLLLLPGGLVPASTPRVGPNILVRVSLHEYILRSANIQASSTTGVPAYRTSLTLKSTTFCERGIPIVEVMADPASIIGVITGLVESADMVFVRTFLYVKALKEKDGKIISSQLRSWCFVWYSKQAPTII